MKKIFPTLAFLLLSLSLVAQESLSEKAVIPLPRYIVDGSGKFVFNRKTKIIVSDNEFDAPASTLRKMLHNSGAFDPEIKNSKKQSKNSVFFRKSSIDSLGNEGYILDISHEKILIIANTSAGAYYAVQTLRQLMPWQIETTNTVKKIYSVPCGTIVDFPEYGYRSMMIDVSRHFFPPQDIKKLIDYLSLFKINTLHMHLSDDQGWRIAIASWPRLAEIGGSTQVGGKKGRFYYTQDEFKDLVKYASEHYITIVPEIDMPGHTNAALASYSELNCDGKARPLYTGTHVGFSSLCVTKPVVYKFVDDVVREISAMTPGLYFHIGGDESNATPHDGYLAFVDSAKNIVSRHGKTMIGWGETSAADIDSTVVVQFWANKKNAQRAVDKGAKVIFSPAKYCYLDMKYTPQTKLGLHWAGYVDVKQAYNWSPDTLVDGIPKKDILGIESPLWTETVKTLDDIEYMTFPRICGHAEIGWTPAKKRSWNIYSKRLLGLYPRLRALGINFYESGQLTESIK